MSIINNIGVPIIEVNRDSDVFGHENPDMSIGARVREARKEAKLSQKQLAVKVGMSQPAISELEKGESFGTKYVASIAAVLGINALWLEAGRGPKRSAQNADISTMENSVRPKVRPEEVEIPQYSDIGGGMGVGLLLRDQPGEIHGWRVTPEWINKNVKSHTSASNLRIVTGFGDSMRPLYNPGDPLLVDAGVKAVEFDSIYFFRIGDEGFIKRLQRVPGQGLVAISENKSYRDWIITPDMDFEVFARVIKVWCGSDF